jgi:hypothetical protein
MAVTMKNTVSWDMSCSKLPPDFKEPLYLEFCALHTPASSYHCLTGTRVGAVVVMPFHPWVCWSRVCACRLTILWRCNCLLRMWLVAANCPRAVTGDSPSSWLASMPWWVHCMMFRKIHSLFICNIMSHSMQSGTDIGVFKKPADSIFIHLSWRWRRQVSLKRYCEGESVNRS